MGINGLLPLLKSIHKSCNLKKFEGKTLGVDAYGWLHRGTVSCAMELAMGKPTRKFVDFAMHRVRMLQHFGVIPYMIFDGDYLPSKAATEADRSKRREESKRAGMELLNAGKTSQAYLEFQKAVDVTPEMARQLIDELRKTGVQYIVAPYEADAQMVYLERNGVIDGILSEDSDLLVFGAKCLLTKLDQYGNCIEINKADFSACREITLTGWSEKEFRTMAILSGCDYLASINNMGLKTAYRMVRKHKTIEKIIRMLTFDGKFHVPQGYLEAFRQAEFTFLHQRVFCTKELRLVLHTQPEQPLDLDRMPYLGAFVEPKIAQSIARGDLNPITKLPMDSDTENIGAPPAISWSSRAKRETATSSVNMRKGVSIERFFKAKRIPLAELDINCFTPSPSQQDVLSRNTGSWMASSAPSLYLNRSTTEPQLPHSAPPQTQDHSVQQGRASINAEIRPQKRVRLCADVQSILPSPSQQGEPSTSRFFGNPKSEESPSVLRSFRNKKSKKQDTQIFSDDSIEEAMLSLPDISDEGNQLAKPGKKVAIFEEIITARGGDTEASSLQQAAAEAPESQESTASVTSSFSQASSAKQPPTLTETDFVPTPMEKLKENFAFGASREATPKSSAVSTSLITPSSSVPRRQSRIPLPIKSATITKGPAFSTKTSLTPLQRLGASAVNQSKLPMTPPMTPLIQAKAKSPRRSLLSKASLPFPEVVGKSKKATSPASTPLPLSGKKDYKQLSTPTGSEDLIIRDSEDEENELSGDDTPTLPVIDLRRFAFPG
ncbi:uncharacterized protein L3040_003787 [Drepanopeziza brunnea f. sp. 'multigermtubi']|uniref:Putative exonuclease n=1 Tax=Marssonina brunnea f. sp. multigermtubi (strain MB_m1) TaxID=1072389 RepID=K1WCB6_MARBU|nr:putative exonuclease [Drepanopeziza brunnea f. sp. 'multigermtubi' MB_m1]EKD15015.1 putative exonuclease [Drepanopeziza brunnea f. sp. 'multigermtubi' MB_m1]KAJ5046547.1 hypothetical protein L3040_003787 [Drepanopeziza brunnea f. sp. 'multigermtubi']